MCSLPVGGGNREWCLLKAKTNPAPLNQGAQRESKGMLLRIRNIVIHQVSSWKLLAGIAEFLGHPGALLSWTKTWSGHSTEAYQTLFSSCTGFPGILIQAVLWTLTTTFWLFNIQNEYLRIFGVISLQISEIYFRTFPGRPLRNCEHVINCDASLLLIGGKKIVALVSGSEFTSSIEKSDGNFIWLLFCCQKESNCQWLLVWHFLSPSLLGQ